jgi:hypothetical protein
MKYILILLFFIGTVFGSQKVTIGILAFNTKAETLKQWGPTAHYLNTIEPGYTFSILPLTYPEMNDAVKNKRIDFVITNPGHYVYLEKLYHISRIATMGTNKNLYQSGRRFFRRA